MKFLLRFTVLTLSLLLVAGPHAHAAPHTFHTSLMRLEENTGEKLGEITLQVLALDLVAALTAENGGVSVNLDKDKDLPQRIQKYLDSRLVLQDAAGQPQKFTWIGLERAPENITIYLETPLLQGLSGLRLRNTILFEVGENQVNLVNIILPSGRVALSYEHGDTAFKTISAPAE